jgi:hypothetical protein
MNDIPKHLFRYIYENDLTFDKDMKTLMPAKREKLTPAQKYDRDGDGKVDKNMRAEYEKEYRKKSK